ncbi:MAG: Yip1 family protein [Proteobacteria bacterium]|nr:Yip1 family protein [Pseudomonadota bacterium]MDA1351521.1 Yip1 family protein [Pseudomonadota bacterium]
MSSNSLQACVDILTSPRETFDALKNKKGWSWAPFGLVIASTVALFLYYFTAVDFEWMIDQMLEQMASQKNMSSDELQATQDYMTKTSMTWSSTLGGAIGIIVINAIMAVYFYLTTKVSSPNELTYGAWYGFSWWVSMPIVVSYFLGALVIAFSNEGMVSLEDLSPTSLKFLAESSSVWYSFAGSLNLFSLWSIALGTIGLSSWLNIPSKKTFMIAVAPSLVIYAIWAIYIGFSG